MSETQNATTEAAAFELRSTLPILEAISRRYSPRSFAPAAVTGEEVTLMLEAARWASSSRNEQPWRFGVFHLGGTMHERIASTLTPSNRVWAANAPLYIVAMAKRSFARNGQENHHAWHDLGLAVGNLSAQATALGLGLHQMAGFDGAAIRQVLEPGDDMDVVTVLAIGRPGSADALPEEYRDRERTRSQRLSLEEIVVLKDR